MIEEKPGDFVRVVATQMPKEFKISESPLAELSDDELEEMITFIRASLEASGFRNPAGVGADEKTKH